jgi:hypothetical protein
MLDTPPIWRTVTVSAAVKCRHKNLIPMRIGEVMVYYKSITIFDNPDAINLKPLHQF